VLKWSLSISHIIGRSSNRINFQKLIFAFSMNFNQLSMFPIISLKKKTLICTTEKLLFLRNGVEINNANIILFSTSRKKVKEIS